MNRTRAAMVIARRDFSATVLSKTFFFFLFKQTKEFVFCE